MIQLKLYKFNKKLNSTRDPVNHVAESEITLSGYFRNPTSIINPIIEFSDIVNVNIYEYNYVYITQFKRFYFISNMTVKSGMWTLYLKEDLLATYHDSIHNSTQYVTRSYSSYNNHIIDTFYKTTADNTNNYGEDRNNQNSVIYRVNRKTGDSANIDFKDFFHTTLANGCYVLSILGNTSSGNVFYVMDSSGFMSFLTNCLALVPSNMGDFSGSVVKNAVYNPMQYVTFCKWFPIMPLNLSSSSLVSTVYVGSQPVSISSGNCYTIGNNFEEEFSIRFHIPRHPETNGSNYGYQNLSPYSQYNISSRLFGNIPVDSMKIYGRTLFDMVWTVDYCSGDTFIKLANDYDMVTRTGDIFFTTTCSTGVTIPLATLVMDVKSAFLVEGIRFVNQLLPEEWRPTVQQTGENKTAMDMLTQAFTGSSGNDSGETIYLADAIADALGSMLGQVSEKGSASSFASYGEYPLLYAWYVHTTPRDDTRFGRPLYASTSLANMSGFVSCLNAYISTFLGSNAESFDEPSNPLQAEVTILNNLLNSGIYLE